MKFYVQICKFAVIMLTAFGFGLEWHRVTGFSGKLMTYEQCVCCGMTLIMICIGATQYPTEKP